MKLAIIEDEQIDSELLGRYIKAWGKERNISVVITLFPNVQSFLSMWKETRFFDVLLTDIQMEEMDGIEITRRVMEVDSDITIVFTTDSADKMKEVSRTGSAYCLLKPVSQERLFRCMDYVQEKQKVEKFLLVRTKKGTLKIAEDKIMYVEAQDSGCVVEFCPQAGRTFQLETTDDIAVLQDRLDKTDFVRCHRAYIVRIDKIRYINRGWIEMNNGSRIGVSRKLYKDVGRRFMRYYHKEKEKNNR